MTIAPFEVEKEYNRMQEDVNGYKNWTFILKQPQNICFFIPKVFQHNKLYSITI